MQVEIVNTKNIFLSNAKKIDTPNGWDVEGDVARAHDVSTSISISQLLRSVKEVFDDTLSEDVYEHFGVNRRKSDFSEGLRYALPGKNKLDTEYLELAKDPEKDDIRYALADNGTVMSAPAGIFSVLRQKAYISVALSPFTLGRFWFLRTDFRIFMQN